MGINENCPIVECVHTGRAGRKEPAALMPHNIDGPTLQGLKIKKVLK